MGEDDAGMWETRNVQSSARESRATRRTSVADFIPTKVLVCVGTDSTVLVEYRVSIPSVLV